MAGDRLLDDTDHSDSVHCARVRNCSIWHCSQVPYPLSTAWPATLSGNFLRHRYLEAIKLPRSTDRKFLCLRLGQYFIYAPHRRYHLGAICSYISYARTITVRSFRSTAPKTQNPTILQTVL